MVSVGMHEARSNLSKRVDRALEGEDVTITRNGTPVAGIVPVEEHTPSMRDCLGVWKGQVDIDEPFEPVPDGLQDLFEGNDDHDIAP
ncbi:MAG: type II toxin-antitoxin system prevent-host-death family antitoxin [Actinobacteria bacterium]|nr:type II toxin-antitoxin system prevent-host-death family antitoxin [Actinomycetota bacterium]